MAQARTPDDVRHSGLVKTVLGKAGQRSVQDLLLPCIAFGLADFWHWLIKTD
jgi:hypothetical protein